MSRIVALLAGLALLHPAAGLAQQNWPQFRGLSGGVAEDPRLPAEWDTQKNVAWKVSVPGRGSSSPVVRAGKAFLTTVVSEGTPDDAKKGLYLGGDRLQPSKYTYP